MCAGHLGIRTTSILSKIKYLCLSLAAQGNPSFQITDLGPIWRFLVSMYRIVFSQQSQKCPCWNVKRIPTNYSFVGFQRVRSSISVASHSIRKTIWKSIFFFGWFYYKNDGKSGILKPIRASKPIEELVIQVFRKNSSAHLWRKEKGGFRFCSLTWSWLLKMNRSSDKKAQKKNPHPDANWLSKFTFWWVNCSTTYIIYHHE